MGRKVKGVSCEFGVVRTLSRREVDIRLRGNGGGCWEGGGGGREYLSCEFLGKGY